MNQSTNAQGPYIGYKKIIKEILIQNFFSNVVYHNMINKQIILLSHQKHLVGHHLKIIEKY